MLRQPDIFIGQFVRLFTQAAGNDRAHFVEAFKRLGQFASGSDFNSLAILLDLHPLLFVTAKLRVLPPNCVKLDRLDTGIPFNGHQRIGRRNRSMLARVARQNHPRLTFPRQPE